MPFHVKINLCLLQKEMFNDSVIFTTFYKETHHTKINGACNKTLFLIDTIRSVKYILTNLFLLQNW